MAKGAVDVARRGAWQENIRQPMFGKTQVRRGEKRARAVGIEVYLSTGGPQ